MGCGETRCRVEAIAKLGYVLLALIISMEGRIHEQLTGEVFAPVA